MASALFIPGQIPPELQAVPQWVTAGPDKVPIKPLDGTNASPTNPDHWGTFDQSVTAARRRGHRPGFCLTSGIVFVDIDRCRDAESGMIEPWAADILARFPGSYAEVSGSGRGLHILGRSTQPLPPGRRREGRIELYDTARYALMTGHVLEGHERLGDVTEAVMKFHRETFPPAAARQPQIPPGGSPVTLEDAELIDRARGARNGHKFDQLWRGDTSAHGGDASAADLALLSMLAFWTQDEAQLDRVFRQSGLCRPKWTDRVDYRIRTLRRALKRAESYTPPPARPTVRPNSQDASFATETGDGLPDDLAALRVLVLDLRAEVADLRGQVDEERRARLAAEARAERSARLQSRTADILRNPHLGQERVAAVALSHEFAHRESAGDTGRDGLYRVPLARVAERAGVSKETASRSIKRLATLGVLSRRIVTVPESIDTETGEIIPMHRELFVGPTTDALSFAEAVATIVPEAPKPKWGGTPNRCPDHPDAKVIRRTTWECAAPGCGHILGETVIGPLKHPAEAAGADDPNSQDASFDPTAPVTAKHRETVDDVLSSNIFAELVDPPLILGSIGAEWLAGGHPPGEPGHDQWTQ